MRCFAACWPDDATRDSLERVARAAHARFPAARRPRADNLHLTLAFIGELALPQAREAAAALRDACDEPFDWRIDHIGRFGRARVLWAGGPEEPRLTRLAERVRDRLRALRVRFDEKRFAAHVTLLRDLPAQPMGAAAEVIETIDPFMWPVRSASLHVSERDAQGAIRYRALDPA
jgi:2'-5' RNA ligase